MRSVCRQMSGYCDDMCIHYEDKNDLEQKLIYSLKCIKFGRASDKRFQERKYDLELEENQ